MLLMICPISALFFLTFSQKLWVPCRFMSKKMEIKNDGIELNEIQNNDPLYQNRFLFEESLSIILPVNTNTGNFNISLRTPSITLSSRIIFLVRAERRCMKDRPYPLVRRKHQTICLRSWRFCLRFRALKIRTKKTGNKAGRRISLDDPLLVLTAASLFLFVYSEVEHPKAAATDYPSWNSWTDRQNLIER